MSESSDNRPARTGHGLHYLIAFTSFAIVVLILASGKVRQRLREEKQQFHGIQEMQRGVDRDKGAELEPDRLPETVSIQPLVWLLVAPLITAWLILLWRRFRTLRNTREST